MGPRQNEKENWLLIKEKDEAARHGAEADITTRAPKSVLQRHPKKIVAPVPSGATKKSMPEIIRPQLATLSDHVPDGDDWLAEVKFDGYRVLCRIDHGKVRLWS